MRTSAGVNHKQAVGGSHQTQALAVGDGREERDESFGQTIAAVPAEQLRVVRADELEADAGERRRIFGEHGGESAQQRLGERLP